MAGERLPTLLDTQGDSGRASLRPRSLEDINRDFSLLSEEFRTSSGARRSRMAAIRREMAELDAEMALLANDVESQLNMLSPLDIGSPDLPIEGPGDDDVPASLTRAGKSFVDQLPDICLKDFPDDTSCHICMDPFSSTEDPESPVRLPCGHVMGRNCISKWLTTSNSCPLCRFVLFEHEVWTPPLTDTELEGLLETTGPLSETELSDLLLMIRSGVETGLSVEGAAHVAVELHEIRRQQAAIDTRLTGFEARTASGTLLRGWEIREMDEDNEVIRSRLANFNARHRELIDNRDITLSRSG